MSPTDVCPPATGRRGAFLFLLALTALLLSWIPATYSMVWRWMRSEDYYSHGLLIPLISAWLIWARRGRLRGLEVRRCRWGLLLLAGGTLGQLISAYAGIAFASGFSILLILLGLVWYVYGTAVFRRLLFPLVFLAFMVPLPMELLERVGFRMKMWAAGVSTVVLRDLLALPCAREGSVIRFMHTQLEVGTPCSGLRSLIALTALGALVAYWARLTGWRRVFLFLASVPFALASNVVRITVLGLITYRWGPEVATGNKFIHYGAGFLVFFVAVVLLMGLWRLLRIGRGRVHPIPPAPKCPAPLERLAKFVVLLAFAKALCPMFLIEGLVEPRIDKQYLASVEGMPTAQITSEMMSDYLRRIRLERVARATVDVDWAFLALLGVVFLVRGFPWARRYLQGLVGAGIVADAGFVGWLLLVERIPLPSAEAGLSNVLVALHLVLYAGVSTGLLVWMLWRLKEEEVQGALGVVEPVESRAPGFTRRAWVGAVWLLTVMVVTWWLVRPAPLEAGLVRARNVPIVIGPWVGRDVEPDPVVVETLQTRDILGRYYRRPDSPFLIQLSVVFSQHNRRATHPPEVCLRGGGWETALRRKVVLDAPRGPNAPTTPFIELLSKRGERYYLLSFYTFKAGAYYTNDYWRQQWAILLSNLRGRPARGALVRFSTPVLAEHLKRARPVLLEFIRQAMPKIEAALEGEISSPADFPPKG